MSVRPTIFLVAVITTACGTAPPPLELLDARAALDRASYGPASQYDPAGLHEARGSLEIAEKTYQHDGASDKTRDRAYVTMRKVERVETLARTRALEAATYAAERRVWLRQMQRYFRSLGARGVHP